MFGIAIEIWVIVGLIVLATMLLMSAFARLYRKAGPHEALIVYGVGGTRVVKGHGTIVLPMVQVCQVHVSNTLPSPGVRRLRSRRESGVPYCPRALSGLVVFWCPLPGRRRCICGNVDRPMPSRPDSIIGGEISRGGPPT
jgi:hypothetical protein